VPAESGFLFTSTALETIPLPGHGDAVRFGYGWNEEYDLAVALDDGQVYASHREVREVTFTNGDALRFLEFLLQAAHLQQAYERTDAGLIDKSEYLSSLEEALGRLGQVDPPAMRDGAWWNGVFDDFKLI
jgi:SUKH-4 immunity protein